MFNKNKENTMSGELSHFEQKSVVTPKQTPYMILGGTVLAIIIAFIINSFVKNEAVEDLHKIKEQAAATSTTAPASKNNEDIDI
jgi:fucose permease